MFQTILNTGIACEKIGMELCSAAFVKAVTDGFVEEFRGDRGRIFPGKAADIADGAHRATYRRGRADLS